MLILLLSTLEARCLNNTYRYSLQQPSNVPYYHLCSDFAPRTCCSPQDFQNLTKKTVQPQSDISFGCKSVLYNSLCSECDGSIGDGSMQGICKSHCDFIYQRCSEDYFTLSGKLKTCTNEDIVCSKLKDIISPSEMCEVIGLTVQPQENCWSGSSTHLLKGEGVKLPRTFEKPRRKRTNTQFSEKVKNMVQLKGLNGEQLLLLLGWIMQVICMVSYPLQLLSARSKEEMDRQRKRALKKRYQKLQREN